MILPQRRAILAVLALGCPALLLPCRGRAEAARVATPGGVALSGFDPVAYFTEGRAVPGAAGQALRWRGAVWYFASAANRNAFEMNPAAYAPQFGGHCAVSMAEGRAAAGDPRIFVILDGKLYLAVSQEALDTLSADPEPTIARALANWRKIRGH